MLLIHRSIHCKSQFAIVSVALGAFNVKWRSDCYQVLYRVWLNVVPSTCMVAPIKVQIVLQVHSVHVWYPYGTRSTYGGYKKVWLPQAGGFKLLAALGAACLPVEPPPTLLNRTLPVWAACTCTCTYSQQIQIHKYTETQIHKELASSCLRSCLVVIAESTLALALASVFVTSKYTKTEIHKYNNAYYIIHIRLWPAHCNLPVSVSTSQYNFTCICLQINTNTKLHKYTNAPAFVFPFECIIVSSTFFEIEIHHIEI